MEVGPGGAEQRPLPQDQTSRWADSASVCCPPQASSSTATLSPTWVGVATVPGPGTPHCPPPFSPHMSTAPSSVTAPLWKLPAATHATRWPLRALSS